jgi:antibiotic biosynthesis monooxygenase (ABM) superfamily enzyme
MIQESPDKSVTVVVTRTPKPGREPDYEEWLRGVAKVSMRFPGHLGLTVLRPPPGSRRYTIVFRFDTVEHLQAWESSDERRAWVARAAAMCEDTEIARLTGMETWFTLPGGGAMVPPPRWKMVIVTFAVAYPLIQIFTATLGAWLSFLHPLVRGAIMGACLVLTMTYVGMPLATRLLKRWLFPAPRA